MLFLLLAFFVTLPLQGSELSAGSAYCWNPDVLDFGKDLTALEVDFSVQADQEDYPTTIYGSPLRLSPVLSAEYYKELKPRSKRPISSSELFEGEEFEQEISSLPQLPGFPRELPKEHFELPISPERPRAQISLEKVREGKKRRIAPDSPPTSPDMIRKEKEITAVQKVQELKIAVVSQRPQLHKSYLEEKDVKWLEKMKAPSIPSEELMEGIFKEETNLIKITFNKTVERLEGKARISACALIILAAVRDYHSIGTAGYRQEDLIFRKMAKESLTEGASFNSILSNIYGSDATIELNQKTAVGGMIDSVWSWLFQAQYTVEGGYDADGKVFSPVVKKYQAVEGSLAKEVMIEIQNLRAMNKVDFIKTLGYLGKK